HRVWAGMPLPVGRGAATGPRGRNGSRRAVSYSEWRRDMSDSRLFRELADSAFRANSLAEAAAAPPAAATIAPAIPGFLPATTLQRSGCAESAHKDIVLPPR